MQIYSYDLPELFCSVLYNQDLKKGFYIIELCIKNFPRDSEGTTMIILESLYENSPSIKHKLILELLMNYYLELLRR